MPVAFTQAICWAFAVLTPESMAMVSNIRAKPLLLKQTGKQRGPNPSRRINLLLITNPLVSSLNSEESESASLFEIRLNNLNQSSPDSGRLNVDCTIAVAVW